jgi:hypothetical protein
LNEPIQQHRRFIEAGGAMLELTLKAAKGPAKSSPSVESRTPV